MPSKKKLLFAETTEVSVQKSVGDIMGLLVEAGALAISQNLEAGRTSSLSFVLPYGNGRIPYLLPVRVEPIFKRLNGRRQWNRGTFAQKDREQAERIAWRQLYWWLKSQLALISLGMVESAEVLMPYMLAPDGRTFFDTYRGKMLEAPKEAAG